MRSPLLAAAHILEGPSLNRGNYSSAIARLTARHMLTARVSPTEMGFAQLMSNEDLASSDGVYKKISDLVKCIVDVLEALDFKDAEHTQPIVDVFSDQWKKRCSISWMTLAPLTRNTSSPSQVWVMSFAC